MSIWDRFLYLIGLRQSPGPRTYRFDANESLQISLSTLSSNEGRPETELIPDILAAGLQQYQSSEELIRTWRKLTVREQEVAALVCLGYTNREIAARLNISPATVKTRLQNILRKYDLHKRTELRELLSIWDFSSWQ